ncbi:hypothetical protein ERJ75_000835800 [Trypanosoma vivax]|uniref:Present in the outer mitochondrial membrane proteome 34 n=1 Tax=Trypanosoma vivax (strain Y486) TaxID=1055687 RepID=G0TYW5_TRYVY|nr:hypothetical protein TRVL_01700 [Trypanosoma vivax]KAH8612954.1 hypothetical protein ERJ75_000835800 [Trypanosoma vivax]CCC49168.1 conserved hypothetical protein [Trypanosoma vivax Y486]
MNGSNSVTSAGSVGLTVVLAGCAALLSAITYIANRRRTNESASPIDRNVLGGQRQASNHGLTSCPAGVARTEASATASHSATGEPSHDWYYLRRAEQHVSRHNASTMEWRDDVLGIRMLFSPILFAVETEERQAPLLLVGLRYLRQLEHRVAVTIEVCDEEMTPEEYRDGSLAHVRDCAMLLSGTGCTRVGSVQLPSAEYCYVDNGGKLRYALSVFMTHKRFAVTAQYVADTRVKGVLPTAFNELVRSIQFSTPRCSPSYLLCAEPSLGLGFRLPLDFVMDEQLRDVLAAAGDPLSSQVVSPHGAAPTAVLAVGESRGGEAQHFLLASPYDTESARANSLNSPPAMYPLDETTPSPCNPHALAADSVSDYSNLCPNSRNRANNFGGSTAIESNVISVPYAAISGAGARRMVIVASYESLLRVRASWQVVFEHHLRTAVRRFSVLRRTSGSDGALHFSHYSNDDNIVVAWSDEALPCVQRDAHNTFVVRPQQLVVPTSGDGTVEEDVGNTLRLDGAFCIQEVFIDACSPCASYLRDNRMCLGQERELEQEAEGEEQTPLTRRAYHTHNRHGRCERKGEGSTGVTTYLSAYLGIFCLLIRNECVSMSFLFSTAHHTLEEVVTFCRRTLDTVSLGNHYGQSTSLLYCNRRHEVLPFNILLNSVGATSVVHVEEPMIGDPLAFFRVAGLERLSVSLRVFPFPHLTNSSQAFHRRIASRLEKIVRNYLLLLPGRVDVRHWERAVLGSRTALELHYELLSESEGNDGEVAGADLFDVDRMIGNVNPFVVVGTTSLAANDGGGASRQGDEIHPMTFTMPGSVAKPSAVPSLVSSAVQCGGEPLLHRSPSIDSREEPTPLHVAVVVCCEGCAFVVMATPLDYPLNIVRHVLRLFATNLSPHLGSTV